MTTKMRPGTSRGGAWLGRIVVLLAILAGLIAGTTAGADQQPPQIESVPRSAPGQPPAGAAQVGKSPQQLPNSFDWRNVGGVNYVTPVKRQGDCGSGYAFAYLAGLESKLLIDGAGTFDLSENNAKECNWEAANNYPGWGSCSGGNSIMMTTLLSQKGTVLESCDPYVDSNVVCKGSCPYEQTIADWRFLAREWIPSPDMIKEGIQDYGPVIAPLYVDPGGGIFDYDGSYTLDYSAPGNQLNHAVLIVGWSDNLPPVRGGTGPAEGWIFKNSWGTDWGNDGYGYITYGSGNIGIWSSFVQDWRPYDADEESWYYDEAGWIDSYGLVGGQNRTAWGLVRYTPYRGSSITRVEFWTTNATVDVDIYVYDDFDGTQPSGLLAQSLNHAYNKGGFHSVDLPTPVFTGQGDDIVVVIKFENSYWGYPVAADERGPIETGRTFFSLTGDPGSWTDMSIWGADAAIRVRAVASAEPVPHVHSITPSSGLNTGTVQITELAGSNFANGATVRLAKSGQPPLFATNVNVVSPNLITCTFDLAGRATGSYDVVVENPDGRTGTLTNGFRIREPGQASYTYLPEIYRNFTIAGSRTVQEYASDDTTVVEAFANVNLGGMQDMWVGYDHCLNPPGEISRSLVKFALSSIPAGAKVVKAELNLRLTNSCDIGERNHTVTVYRTSEDWSSATTMWDNQPTYAEAYGATSIPSRSWGWYEFDVTELVRAWMNGTYPNYGLMLRASETPGDESARLGFTTIDMHGTTYDPYLVVDIISTGAAVQSQVIPAAEADAPGGACELTVSGALGQFPTAADAAAAGFSEWSACEPR